MRDWYTRPHTWEFDTIDGVDQSSLATNHKWSPKKVMDHLNSPMFTKKMGLQLEIVPPKTVQDHMASESNISRYLRNKYKVLCNLFQKTRGMNIYEGILWVQCYYHTKVHKGNLILNEFLMNILNEYRRKTTQKSSRSEGRCCGSGAQPLPSMHKAGFFLQHHKNQTSQN